MTDQQWETLKKIIEGEKPDTLPVGFIIDCPWLPNWAGMNILDYFSNDELWLNANLKALRDFPEVIFLPGFWSEFGMCTEPSAWGAKCTFPSNEFPHAHKILNSIEDIKNLKVPKVTTDGLLPFVLNRLKLAQPKIEASGHKIRFAVARGPLNIASFLMGTTEMMMALMMNPDEVEELVLKITQFLKDWLTLQMETFPTIDGIFLLDDIIGFVGEPEFLRFGFPYFKQLFDLGVSVKFLHNDSKCEVSAPHLANMGVNLFNMGFDVHFNDLKKLTENKVTLFGNIPPRDVLASGNTEDVEKVTRKMLDSLEDFSRIVLSCGGGMPPGVKNENIQVFIDTVKNYKI
ncbi:MAG: uroporphyrinogen decarboxylase [Candidatus Marinimicrobia bacterium]|nr:uroporphyrinogen decarboxylase [Candidatus Neomarinimicrobiota bacterium]